MKHNAVSQWMSGVPDVGLYWPIYLLEVNSSIQYSLLVRQTLQSRLGLMMLDWNILLLLAWMYFWHISFVSTWRPWWTCIRASPKDGLVTSCFAGTFWSFGKHWRIALHLYSQLAVCSQCTGAAWHLETDLHQHAEDIPKGWQGDSVQVASPSGQLTPSALQASRLELVDLPPRTSCSCDVILCRLDFSFRRLTGTGLNLNLSKLVVVWDWYGTNGRCLVYF